LSYVAMIVLGRAQDRGVAYLQYSLYHFYILALFNTIFIYALFIGLAGRVLQQKKFIALIVSVGLILSTSLNAYQSLNLNKKMRGVFGGWARFIQSTDRFVDSHKQEQDFSFKFYWREEYRFDTFIFLGDPKDGLQLGGLASDHLFAPYIQKDRPKYYLAYSNQYGLASFRDKEEVAEYTKSVLHVR